MPPPPPREPPPAPKGAGPPRRPPDYSVAAQMARSRQAQRLGRAHSHEGTLLGNTYSTDCTVNPKREEDEEEEEEDEDETQVSAV